MDPLAAAFERLGSLSQKKAGPSESPVPQCICGGVTGYALLAGPDGSTRFTLCPACDPTLHCPRCEGSGKMRQFDFATLTDTFYAQNCDCTILASRLELLNDARLPPRYLNSEFIFHEADFPLLTTLPETLQQQFVHFHSQAFQFSKRCLQSVAESRSPRPPFLLLAGDVGTGKTTLACATLKSLIREGGLRGKFLDFQWLLASLREAYVQKHSEGSILWPYLHTDVLLLDDFGKVRTENEWQLEKLDEIISHRYNHNRITLMTTAYLPPHALAERIGQRLLDG